MIADEGGCEAVWIYVEVSDTAGVNRLEGMRGWRMQQGKDGGG